MLKKMRWRFIGAAMGAFAAVILALLCVINLWNYVNITRQQDNTLEFLSQPEREGKPPAAPGKSPGPGQFSPEVQYMMRFFVVFCDANGEVRSVNQDYIASVSREDAVNYAQRVLENDRTSGYMDGYRFHVYETFNGIAVYFLNSERELHAMKALLLITGLVAICCLAAVFLLVLAFSHRAIAPYIRNIETQKRFVTDAGHELKTPLTAISTSADVLAMEMEENEWVQNIRLQSGRMSKLIADLVTLSRLDEERPFPDMADFSLSEAVWEISEPFASLAEAKGKEYVPHIEEGILLHGDRNAISQMVSILLDNAVKYSDPNGKIRLDVRKLGRRAEISVYNTCRLSDTDNLDRLFDRFYRSDASRNSRDSYGLGLSIAKSIAENHGGSIRADSQDGYNLTITIQL